MPGGPFSLALVPARRMPGLHALEVCLAARTHPQRGRAASRERALAAMLFSAFRSAVLQHLRVPVLASSSSQQLALPALSTIIARGFAGGFLEKDKVTERVIYVAKHFEKVDPAKVRPTARGRRAAGARALGATRRGADASVARSPRRHRERMGRGTVWRGGTLERGPDLGLRPLTRRACR